ncbi:polyprenyl synthetase family protein [Demequina sp. SYSU T00039]|uniref:Polyprenyl synthetase family protein n=1 Tax=Demequina lignilytica TaxID=3051663 RepID=A0AAW7M1U6_9MICO|nr:MULTISPECIES: polyprenyl synthetase family protein [unclassified Demequina]MDN4486805.1 polyprenyl synthetase family protein [Demequina sp. SYSU T00039]MDN4489489.1 polyprenyl synthetase family protein [Demequina sp. SYSU T00068]
MDDPRAAIDVRVHRILGWLRDVAGPTGVAADEIHARLVQASEGGKAFRGRLVIAAAEACGGASEADVVGVAAALELFQTAALIHDDVLDGSDMRRGRPATHRAFEASHRARGGLGEPAAYGTAGAILAGDIALVAALHAAAEVSYAADPRIEPLFAEMAVLVTAGQHLDMHEATVPLDAERLPEAVQTVMRSKTASYTAEMPLALGAALAGADDAVVAAVRDAGVPLGIAFQLRDDVLGVLGASDVTGKPVGDDLREGKRTLLIAHVLAHGTAAQRADVLAVLGDPQAGAPDIDAAIAALRASGAVHAVEQAIAAAAGHARAALHAALPDPTPVLALVDAAIDRAS